MAEVFRMLADGTRIRILWALIDSELSVNEIAAEVGKSGPAVSQHLAKLRMARLVRTAGTATRFSTSWRTTTFSNCSSTGSTRRACRALGSAAPPGRRDHPPDAHHRVGTQPRLTDPVPVRWTRPAGVEAQPSRRARGGQFREQTRALRRDWCGSIPRTTWVPSAGASLLRGMRDGMGLSQ